ncbi:hypothetical protein C1H46_011459 [Malus baccata]|uniref:Uncharacterized protein n=1 Tax=Malus baccata TaxID=106549 RepID=A0A540MVT8_MALBA|nr:hypothetical protein C1H46_011459 [Malus baccata]
MEVSFSMSLLANGNARSAIFFHFFFLDKVSAGELFLCLPTEMQGQPSSLSVLPFSLCSSLLLYTHTSHLLRSPSISDKNNFNRTFHGLKEEDNDSNSSDLGSDEERDSNSHLGSAEKDEAEEGSLTFPFYG